MAGIERRSPWTHNNMFCHLVESTGRNGKVQSIPLAVLERKEIVHMSYVFK